MDGEFGVSQRGFVPSGSLFCVWFEVSQRGQGPLTHFSY